MKANNGKGNNPSRDEWQTPKELFDKLHEQYNFTFDCCASVTNRKNHFYSDDFQNCKYTNIRMAWMNPPFSKAWLMFEHFFKLAHKGVAIYRCDNLETALWQKIILPNAAWIFIPNKRISYEGLDGMGSRFPSALIEVGVNPPKNLKGTILIPKKSNPYYLKWQSQNAKEYIIPIAYRLDVIKVVD